jgi:hypothetical protein
VTGKLVLDLGSANLPLGVYSHLIHLAKAAVNLCGDCSVGLEGDEPFLGNRAEALRIAAAPDRAHRSNR